MKLKLNKLLATTALIIAGLGITTTSSYASEDRLLYDCEARGEIARGAVKALITLQILYPERDSVDIADQVISDVIAQVTLSDPTISSEELMIYIVTYGAADQYIRLLSDVAGRDPEFDDFEPSGWFYTMSRVIYRGALSDCNDGDGQELEDLGFYPSTSD